MRFTSDDKDLRDNLRRIAKVFGSTSVPLGSTLALQRDISVDDEWSERIYSIFGRAEPNTRRIRKERAIEVRVNSVDIYSETPMFKASKIKDADARFRAYARGGVRP